MIPQQPSFTLNPDIQARVQAFQQSRQAAAAAAAAAAHPSNTNNSNSNNSNSINNINNNADFNIASKNNSNSGSNSSISSSNSGSFINVNQYHTFNHKFKQNFNYKDANGNKSPNVAFSLHLPSGPSSPPPLSLSGNNASNNISESRQKTHHFHRSGDFPNISTGNVDFSNKPFANNHYNSLSPASSSPYLPSLSPSVSSSTNPISSPEIPTSSLNNLKLYSPTEDCNYVPSLSLASSLNSSVTCPITDESEVAKKKFSDSQSGLKNDLLTSTVETTATPIINFSSLTPHSSPPLSNSSCTPSGKDENLLNVKSNPKVLQSSSPIVAAAAATIPGITDPSQLRPEILNAFYPVPPKLKTKPNQMKLNSNKLNLQQLSSRSSTKKSNLTLNLSDDSKPNASDLDSTSKNLAPDGTVDMVNIQDSLKSNDALCADSSSIKDPLTAGSVGLDNSANLRNLSMDDLKSPTTGIVPVLSPVGTVACASAAAKQRQYSASIQRKMSGRRAPPPGTLSSLQRRTSTENENLENPLSGLQVSNTNEQNNVSTTGNKNSLVEVLGLPIMSAPASTTDSTLPMTSSAIPPPSPAALGRFQSNSSIKTASTISPSVAAAAAAKVAKANKPRMKIENKFAQFSKYLDMQTGALKFDNKACVHAQGVDFSSGSSFRVGASDFEEIEELGRGNYGTVYKVLHKPTNVFMALKEIRLELDEARLRAIIMELDILHKCTSPYIVDFYGAFFVEGSVYICMEFMDGGSLDRIYNCEGGVNEPCLSRVAESVVRGLKFLKDEHNVIHRDVKPTNVLTSTSGAVKLCDFGVSGNLVASMARTNIGCQSYMAPERIYTDNNKKTNSTSNTTSATMSPNSSANSTNSNCMGKKNQRSDTADFYSVQSDVWSLGLTIIETATGKYPYPPETYANVFSQLAAIVNGEPPVLPDTFSPQARDFVAKCLDKIPEHRPTYAMLLDHPWLAYWRDKEVDMASFIKKASEDRKKLHDR